MTPTQRTLKKMRDEGWTAAVVERRNPHLRNVTHDLFGFIDVIGIRDGETLAVQTTSASNVSARIKKIIASEHLDAVRKAGWGIHVHGWRKRKSNGRWECRVEDLS